MSTAEPLAFLPGMTEKLGHYVYALRDPRSNEIFYVGKGVGHRVYQHAILARVVDAKEGRRGLKLQTIQAIHRGGGEVEIEILRHGLAEQEAYEAEAVAIDALRAAGLDLTNLVRGHGSRERGWQTLDELRARYAAKPASFDASHRVVLIRINRNYRPGMSDEDMYRYTREWWVMRSSRRPEIALSVYRGIVRAAFRIEPNSWERHDNGRWRFAAHRDLDLEARYAWSDVSSWLPDGSQNPIRYVNC